MNVIQAIAALLYDHDTVVVPALGAFVRTDESAQVNVITNEFQKPSSTLSFDPAQHEENPLLMDYLMLHAELSDEDARQEIAAFVADCYTKLREGETVVLDGIGTLCFNSLQEPVFTPDPTADFNADAFGLEDLEVQPVFMVKDTEPVKSVEEPEALEPEILEPETTKPVSQNPIEKPDQDEPRRHTWWIWLLFLLLLAGLALWYFYLRPVGPKPEPVSPTPIDTLTVVDTLSPVDMLTVPIDTIAVVDTLTSTDTTTAIEVVKPLPESKAFIVGGCFSIEENALKMAKEALEQGCQDAFVMKRGAMYYVCYGQYTSTSNAKAALPEILEKYNRKAWILF